MIEEKNLVTEKAILLANSVLRAIGVEIASPKTARNDRRGEDSSPRKAQNDGRYCPWKPVLRLGLGSTGS
jgi:hypothetical protein